MLGVEGGATWWRDLPWPCLQCGARAAAAGWMLRKRSEAEGSEGNGEVGGRLAQGAEVSRHGWSRTKALMQEGVTGAGRGPAVPPVTTSLGLWPRSGCWVPLCHVACGGTRHASWGEFLTVGVGGIMCTKVIMIPNL